jgi:tRNA(adenine34) deaminase
MKKSSEDFYKRVMDLAKIAENFGEVPIGALIVNKGEIIGEGYNTSLYENDPSAHAEIMALRDAGKRIGNYRLTGSVLYVSLEPCIMCYAAAVHARIKKIFYCTDDPKGGVFSTGAFKSIKNIFNHKIEIESGKMAEESSKLLKEFFKKRRKNDNILDNSFG